MRSNNSNGNRAASAWGFMALFAIMLAMGLGLLASPAEAGPFAYVANDGDGVSVIDTATNPPSVVATVTVGTEPFAVALTRDGTHAYVANHSSNSVSVIETTGNTVMTTITAGVGSGPIGVATTPDGKHAYVSIGAAGNVSVIDTASNTVVGTPNHGGVWPLWGRRHAGRDARLRRESGRWHCFSDRHGQ